MLSRVELIERLQLVMGDLPDPAGSRRVPLDVRLVGERADDGLAGVPAERAPGVLLRKVTFGTEPGDRGWAWLLLPPEARGADGGPRSAASPAPPGAPGVLCLHQTTSIGKDEPAGLGGRPNLHYALELARRGFVALAPDYPHFGDYRCDAYHLGYVSATMKGVWNHMRGIDLLASLPCVAPDHIGVIGHSLGGHNALFLAALDPRVRAAVASCGFTGFAWNTGDGDLATGDVTDWSHAGYMPRILERYGGRAERLPFDWPDVLGLIAPRPVFLNAPERDSFSAEGVDWCVAQVAPRYAEHRAPPPVVRHPPGGHDFPPDVREEAYAFLVDALR